MQVKYEPWSIQKEGKEAWGVKILEGTFNELTIAINDVKLEGDDNVSIDYDIIYSLIPITILATKYLKIGINHTLVHMIQI